MQNDIDKFWLLSKKECDTLFSGGDSWGGYWLRSSNSDSLTIYISVYNNYIPVFLPNYAARPAFKFSI